MIDELRFLHVWGNMVSTFAEVQQTVIVAGAANRKEGAPTEVKSKSVSAARMAANACVEVIKSIKGTHKDQKLDIFLSLKARSAVNKQMARGFMEGLMDDEKVKFDISHVDATVKEVENGLAAAVRQWADDIGSLNATLAGRQF